MAIQCVHAPAPMGLGGGVQHVGHSRVQAACFYYLSPVKTRCRGPPFRRDADTVARGRNLTPTTTLGHPEVLGEIAEWGGGEPLLPHPTILTL